MRDKCPRCGSQLRPGTWHFDCLSKIREPKWASKECLRRQLSAANAKLAEMARLAEETRLNVETITGVGGWRPIETNPEGTMSLYMDRNETDVSKVCWVDWIAGKRGMMFPKRTPTHWMPLPQPPKEADDDDA